MCAVCSQGSLEQLEITTIVYLLLWLCLPDQDCGEMRWFNVKKSNFGTAISKKKG